MTNEDRDAQAMFLAGASVGEDQRGAFAIAYALMRVADAQTSIAYQLKCLGTGDAATTMGALEMVGVKIGELATATDQIAEAIKDHAGD